MDDTFGDVAAMGIGGHKLACGFPDFSDVSAVLLARFVVKDLVVYNVAESLQSGHDAGIGWDAVVVFTCLEGIDSDGVGVAVIGDYEVLVAAAGADWEASCVNDVERAVEFHPDVELFMVVSGGVGRFLWLGVVERTPCWECVRWPFMVSSLDGKYLAALS